MTSFVRTVVLVLSATVLVLVLEGIVMAEPTFDHGVSEDRIEYEYRDAEYEYEPTAET